MSASPQHRWKDDFSEFILI